MTTNYEAYEVVIGLEVHAQLLTQTKLFCGDSASFGGEPNTHISPVTLAHPGVLPVLNKKAVEFAVKMGLACHSEIERSNYFARKNYFYPDLPKGYQISQHTTPICKGGSVCIRTPNGERHIQLNRIHLEEDAGKSLHDVDAHHTAIDLNRAGVPLIEIVTEPDIRSAEEAHAFLTEIRKIVRYLGICDGNMEEGSLRCDANISIRKKGETRLGTKVEVKNLNSIRNVKRAIEHEAARMMELDHRGGTIIQQTRSYDASNGTTFALRSKEEANDYRYFADPDLPPFYITDEMLEAIEFSIPPLPEALIKKYTSLLHLTEYDAMVITDDRDSAAFFESLVQETTNYKAAANWMLGPIRSYLNARDQSFADLPVSPLQIARLIALVDEGTLNFSIASSRILEQLAGNPGADPLQIASRLNLVQNSDENAIADWVETVLNNMPEKVLEYKKGKKGLIGLFVGEVKKLSKGKADPRLTTQMLTEKLER